MCFQDNFIFPINHLLSSEEGDILDCFCPQPAPDSLGGMFLYAPSKKSSVSEGSLTLLSCWAWERETVSYQERVTRAGK